MSPSEPRQCRHCDAEIRWLTTRAGAKMPVEKNRVRVLVATEERADRFRVIEAWAPHWPNCPGAEEARKGKKKARS